MHGKPIRSAYALVETQRHNAENFLDRRCPLALDVGVAPSVELAQDRVLGVPPHANDERKAELLFVGLVTAMEGRIFVLRQPIEPGAGLLRRRVCSQGAGARGFAGEIGMSLD